MQMGDTTKVEVTITHKKKRKERKEKKKRQLGKTC